MLPVPKPDLDQYYHGEPVKQVLVIDQANGTDYYEVYGFVQSTGTCTISGTTSYSYVSGAVLG